MSNPNRHSIITLFIALIIILPSHATNRYPLACHVPPINEWFYNGIDSARIDSSFTLQGTYPTLFSSVRSSNNMDVLSSERSYSFLLPNRSNNDTIFASITAQTENAGYVSMIYQLVNEDEKMVQSDTLIIPSTSDPLSLSFEITNTEAKKLLLAISARPLSYSTVKKKIWISPLSLECSSPTVTVDLFPRTKELVEEQLTYTIEDYAEINPLNQARILALGEMVHGNESINRHVFNLIKYRIQKCNTKLVLLELGNEQFLSLNRYMQNDITFNFIRHGNLFDNTLFSNSIYELIDWIRSYNLNQPQKEQVWLWGVEKTPNKYYNIFGLIEFFETLSTAYPDNIEIKEFCSLLVKSRDEPYDFFASAFKAYGEFTSILKQEEIAYLNHYFATMTDYEKKRNPIQSFREEDLAESTRYFIDSLTSPTHTTTIYSHYAHANYISTLIPLLHSTSMGGYLRKYYQEDYLCLAITCGEGKTLARQPMKLTHSHLIQEAKSIEKILSTNEKPFFYIDTKTWDTFMPILTSGSTSVSAFYYPCVPNLRAEGLFFTQKSTPAYKPKDLLDKNIRTSEQMLDKMLKKIIKHKKDECSINLH